MRQFVFVVVWLVGVALASAANKEQNTDKLEAATRLQLFLDQAGFGPGKIDGHFGEFTKKAANLYLQSKGREPVQSEADAQAAFQDELAGIASPFTDYTVTEADLDRIGKIPADKKAQSKLKWLGYENPLEAVSERFHSDPAFLKKLNPDIHAEQLQPGTTLRVPNVQQPFDIAAVEERKKEMTAQQEHGGKGEKAHRKQETAEKKGEGNPEPVAEQGEQKRSIEIGTKEAMLKVKEGDQIVAAFPVTCGSQAIPSPIGDWVVKKTNYLPIFRYDKSMLNTGKRSADAVKLPPGPNSPVGIVWISLNKDGIGIHGTDAPETIGRSASHGCIRLSNWDALRLTDLVYPDMPVKITP